MRRLNRTFSPYAAMAGIWLSVLAPVALGDGRDPAELVPADTLAYIGWNRVIEESDTLLDVVPAVMRAMDLKAAMVERTERVLDLVKIAGRGSAGMAVLDFSAGKSDVELPFAVVVDAGAESADLSQGVLELFQTSNSANRLGTTEIGGVTFHQADVAQTLLWTAHDGLFILAMPRAAAEAVIARLGGEGDSLAGSGKLDRIRGSIGVEQTTDSVFCAYVDVGAFIKKLPSVAEEMGDPLPPEARTAMSELGADSLATIYYHSNDSDYGRVNRFYLGINGPAKGVLELWNQKPLTRDDLGLIPKDAYWAAATNLDLGELWAEVRRAAEAIDPEAAGAIDGAVAMIAAMLGFSVTDDLLPALGDTWIVYDAPDHGGLLFTGAALVAEVRDAAAVQGIFSRTLQFVTPLAAQNDVNLVPRRTEHNGHAIDYLVVSGLPVPVAPAAAFVGDRVVCGLSPQVVKVALDRLDAASQDDGILEHPDVQEVRGRLPEDIQSFVYSDTRFAVRSTYWLTHLALTALTSAASASLPDVDPAMLPTLPESLAEVRNGVSVCSADASGVLYTSYGSPAMVMLPPADVAVVALLISILLPSLARARVLAKRAVSAANLKGIGMACYLYASDNQEKFPESLRVILDNDSISEKMLVSPAGEYGADSYVYIAGQSQLDDFRNVLAYERPYGDEGTNVLFLDTHVEFLKLDKFKRQLAETYERLDRLDEMPVEWR